MEYHDRAECRRYSRQERAAADARARVASVDSLSEINVVPLVDVMLVLLIIFMVTAPMMQQGLQVNLPQSRARRRCNAQPVYVTIPAAFAADQRLQIGKDEIGIEALGERVRQALLTRDDKSVFLRHGRDRHRAGHHDRDRPAEGGGRREGRLHDAAAQAR